MRTLLFSAGVWLASFSLQAADASDLETIVSVQQARLKAQEGNIAQLQANQAALLAQFQGQIAMLQAQVTTLQANLTNLQNNTSTHETNLQAQITENANRAEQLHNAQQANINNLWNSLGSNYYARGTIDQLLNRYVLTTRLTGCRIQMGQSDNNHTWIENAGGEAIFGNWQFLKTQGTVDENDRIWYRFSCP